MRTFSRAIFVLLHLILSAVIIALLFHPSADGSTIHFVQSGYSSRPSTFEPRNDLQQSLTISPDSDELVQNPKLLERILEDPYVYFRYINTPFAQAVCIRFQEYLGEIPNVNLQGDAHVENYAITERGRGLTDFDDATIGPMVLDLVRFGVSIHLACRANGWEDNAEEIVDSFLSSYGAALENPRLTIPPPELVARIRARFSTDRERALAERQELMEPLGEPLENFKSGYKQYVDQMKVQHSDLPSYFFDIKKAGRLKMGIGSALDEKYLLRVEGATKANEDDLMLEIKEARGLHGISCILLSKVNPMRPIVIQARLAHEPYLYTGFIVVAGNKGSRTGKTFWVHEWYDNYHELSIRTSFQTPKDLRDIAVDVGVQLGLGHPRNISDTDSSGLRATLASTLEKLRVEIEQTISDLARQTVAAWQQFRREATTGKTGTSRN
ncbi:MAG: DUF2252 family protein [Syntrophobacteria bacterium]